MSHLKIIDRTFQHPPESFRPGNRPSLNFALFNFLKGLNIQYNNGHLLYDIKTAFANVSQHVQSICEELWSSLIRYQLLSMKPCIVFTINIFVSRYKSGLLVGTVRLPLEFQ